MSPSQVPGVVQAGSVLSGGEKRVGRCSCTNSTGMISNALANSGHAREDETRGTGRSCGSVVDILPGSCTEVRVDLSAVNLDVLVVGSSLSESLELVNTSSR